MGKRELSVVELEQLFKGIMCVNINDGIINIHLDGHYFGLSVKGLFLEENNEHCLEIRKSGVWLSYYRERKVFHLMCM